MSFSHYCRKNGSVVFLILSQNVELNSVIQPAKTICEKKISFRSQFKSKMHWDSLLNDLFSTFYILLKSNWI